MQSVTPSVKYCVLCIWIYNFATADWCTICSQNHPLTHQPASQSKNWVWKFELAVLSCLNQYSARLTTGSLLCSLTAKNKFKLLLHELATGKKHKFISFVMQCKLWGFLPRHIVGVTLGMGDYSHLTVEHSAMLFQQHRSFRHYSNQGFEASHKAQRMLYSRATNHDPSAVGQSSKFLLAVHAVNTFLLLYSMIYYSSVFQ